MPNVRNKSASKILFSLFYKKNIKSAASGNKVTLTAFDDAKKEKTYE